MTWKDYLLEVAMQIPMLSLALGTLVSEDLTYIAALAGFRAGDLSLSVVFWGYSLGVVAGDYGLFLLGRWAKWTKIQRIKQWGESLSKIFLSRPGVAAKVDQFLVLTRFVPGTRIPTYVGLGLSDYSSARFLGLMTMASFFYIGVGLMLVSLFPEVSSESGWVHLVTALVAFVLSLRLFRILAFLWRHRGHWSINIQGQLNYYLRYARAEFWPPFVFYIPLGFYFIYLMIRFRGAECILAANPGLEFSGLVGEKKGDMEKLLEKACPDYVLASLEVEEGEVEARIEKTLDFIREKKIEYPVVLKPSQGQRGAGVLIAKDEIAVNTYYQNYHGVVLAQEFCAEPKELGLFYLRFPREERGKIVSVTQKVFPFVVGNGRSTLAELVYRNNLTKFNFRLFEKRFEETWNQVIERGKRFELVQTGNHAQGCVFRNGIELVTPELENWLDEISRKIPGFYIGRFDLRYRDDESLKTLENIKMIELNGAGAEMTDIYDSSKGVFDIYPQLFQQWRWVFEVGKANETPALRNQRWVFLKELWEARRRAGKYLRF